MSPNDESATLRAYWDRAGLPAAIAAALAALYPGRDRLDVEELAPLDQFHTGGLDYTRRLAALACIGRGRRVLDVGGGLGGPARTLAADLGCHVTVLDLAESYVAAGRWLTRLAGLDAQVTHQVGNALALPFDAASFDVVWTQNSGMNIAAKDALYREFRRVLRDGGTLATQEPMAGPVAPRVYPLMWAGGPEIDHLCPPPVMRATMEAAGFRVRAWTEVTPQRPAPGAGVPAQTIQRLVMGEAQLAAIMQAARVNDAEQRVVMVQAACEAAPAQDARR